MLHLAALNILVVIGNCPPTHAAQLELLRLSWLATGERRPQSVRKDNAPADENPDEASDAVEEKDGAQDTLDDITVAHRLVRGAEDGYDCNGLGKEQKAGEGESSRDDEGDKPPCAIALRLRLGLAAVLGNTQCATLVGMHLSATCDHLWVLNNPDTSDACGQHGDRGHS